MVYGVRCFLEATHAQHLLRKVKEDESFRFVNGKRASNLRELLRCVLMLSDNEYRHHVYADHNDFSSWLLDVVGDELLARDLFRANQRQTAALLKARVHFLEEQSRS